MQNNLSILKYISTFYVFVAVYCYMEQPTYYSQLLIMGLYLFLSAVTVLFFKVLLPMYNGDLTIGKEYALTVEVDLSLGVESLTLIFLDISTPVTFDYKCTKVTVMFIAFKPTYDLTKILANISNTEKASFEIISVEIEPKKVYEKKYITTVA